MTNDCKKTIEEVIKKYKFDCTVDTFKDDPHIYWLTVSFYRYLSEDFMEEFSDKLHWQQASRNQKLAESFMEKYKNKVYWIDISECQTLSEPFISKFQDKVYWPHISKFQFLSESFITKFQHKVSWRYILNKYNLSDECFILNEFYINQFDSKEYIEKLKVIKNHIQLQYQNNFFTISLN